MHKANPPHLAIVLLCCAKMLGFGCPVIQCETIRCSGSDVFVQMVRLGPCGWLLFFFLGSRIIVEAGSGYRGTAAEVNWVERLYLCILWYLRWTHSYVWKARVSGCANLCPCWCVSFGHTRALLTCKVWLIA
ncbi:hypothetical protein BDW60DRAFT_189308 [Aspergillus nidulans var. acristatus]